MTIFAVPPMLGSLNEALSFGRKTQPPRFHDREIGRHARHAAEIMEERGWTAGALESPEGRVCALGAMNKACSAMKRQLRIDLQDAFDKRFSGWLWEHYPISSSLPTPPGVAAWNDLILKEDTLQWLHKFADAMDPQ